MRPIRAKKVRPHVGHKWVGAVLAVCAARALRTARFRRAIKITDVYRLFTNNHTKLVKAYKRNVPVSDDLIFDIFQGVQEKLLHFCSLKTQN